jgi:hypothetical protein
MSRSGPGHEQLAERAKLSAVLAHLESVSNDEARRTEAMTAWVRRRLRQIDALIRPLFLDTSARFVEVDFGEQSTEAGAEGAGRYVYYSRPVELRFGRSTRKKGLATSRTALQWLVQAGFASELERGQGNLSADEQCSQHCWATIWVQRRICSMVRYCARLAGATQSTRGGPVWIATTASRSRDDDTVRVALSG